MEITSEIEDQLRRFADAVAASPHNLVSRRARQELWSRHVQESVAVARALPNGRQRLLDVGSGGGFPGFVIALVRPELEVHLLDSTRKKTTFLDELAAELDVPLTVHTGRAEELARGPLAGSFDVVTARAVAALERLIPWTVPFLRPNGLVYAIKGESWAEELAAATGVIERSGARVVATPDEVADGGGSADRLPHLVILGRS